MMTAVVENGTGTNAQIDGVQVAGKTGTAQQGDGRKPHAWFMSFAPADTEARSRSPSSSRTAAARPRSAATSWPRRSPAP